MNLSVVNKNTEFQMLDKYGLNKKLLLWTKLVCRNRFVREFLLERQDRKCAYCGYKIKQEGPHIHHVDYDNLCVFDEPVKDGKTKTTNCEWCWEHDNQQFELCMSKVRVVHKGCNKRISEMRKVLYCGKENI